MLTDLEYQQKYGTMWETQKAHDLFNALPEEQRKIVALEQAQKLEDQKNSLAKVKTYAELGDVQKRFINLLGDTAGRAYVESVVIAVSNKPELQECSPKSIFISAMRAASLRLSVDPALKQAHLVPFKGEATLIVDYHGLTQLSINTGYYEIAPYVSEVYEGETIKYNRFSGAIDVVGEKTSDKVIGWLAYFKAKNGTERWEYMTNEQADAHGKKYNPGGFSSSKSGWAKDPDKMRRKTVLRQLLNKWGNFSPEVKRIIQTEEEDGNIIDAAFEMPSDENIVIPERDPHEAEHKRTTVENLQQLGFGA